MNEDIKNNIKAILFDFDGVIVDSEPLHFEAHKKVLKTFGINLTLEDYMEFGIAKGDDNLYEKVPQKYEMKIDKEAMSKIKRLVYREIFNEKAKLIPGILETLKKFSKEYNLVIVSSGVGDTVRYGLKKLGVSEYFKFVITGDDAKEVKPAPDVYFKAIKLLGYNKENCIAIEDSETGIEAAKNAGIKCIAIPNDFTKKQDFSRADVILSSIKELKIL